MKKVCRQNFPLDNLAPMYYNEYRKKKGINKMKGLFEKILWWILEKRGITWGDEVEKPFDKFIWGLIK